MFHPAGLHKFPGVDVKGSNLNFRKAALSHPHHVQQRVLAGQQVRDRLLELRRLKEVGDEAGDEPSIVDVHVGVKREVETATAQVLGHLEARSLRGLNEEIGPNEGRLEVDRKEVVPGFDSVAREVLPQPGPVLFGPALDPEDPRDVVESGGRHLNDRVDGGQLRPVGLCDGLPLVHHVLLEDLQLYTVIWPVRIIKLDSLFGVLGLRVK